MLSLADSLINFLTGSISFVDIFPEDVLLWFCPLSGKFTLLVDILPTFPGDLSLNQFKECGEFISLGLIVHKLCEFVMVDMFVMPGFTFPFSDSSSVDVFSLVK